MNSNAIKYGVISGIVSIIFSMALYFINPKMMFGGLAYLGMLIPVFFMWKASNDEKKINEGYLPFGEALIISFIVVAIALLISSIFTYILINFIDPSLVDVIKEISIEAAEKVAGIFGADEDSLDEMRDQMDEQDLRPTIFTTLFNYLGSLVVGFIIALIVAAIVKKTRPYGA